MRALHAGEVLYEQGDIAVPFFVVVSGELEIMCPFGAAETLVTVFGPGQFTGEVNTISGRRTFFRVRASKAGKVIELDREHMLALMQTDAELVDIMMRAFILRRVELVAAGMGDVVLIDSITFTLPVTIKLKKVTNLYHFLRLLYCRFYVHQYIVFYQIFYYNNLRK